MVVVVVVVIALSHPRPCHHDDDDGDDVSMCEVEIMRTITRCHRCNECVGNKT